MIELSSVLGWVVLVGLVGAGLAVVVFVLVTDGRYVGKRLVYWVYDLLGPAVFSMRSEERLWRSLIESIGLQGDERILDVGTATGDLPMSVAAMPGFQGQIVGVDWSPRMIALARREAERRGLEDRARFEVLDVRQGLPFPAEAFDVIICLGLLETLPQPDEVLREFGRVLSPSGVLVLSLYRGRAARTAALSLAWYEGHLAALGLDHQQVVPCRKHHDAVIARRTGQGRGGAA